jgi:hypothetical protein
MKLGIAIGLASSLAIVIATSCNITHKSDDYSCTTTLDCDPGRLCSSDGFCVLGTSIDAAKGDAPRTGDAAPMCPPGCTSCNVTDKSCTIDCTKTSCNTALACPAGYKCDILCNTDNSCRQGINCRQGTGCNIECSGNQSCRGITCGSGACDVSCSGASSCRNVQCGSSCACDVTCTGNQSCPDAIFCKYAPALTCDTGSGCTSMKNFCNTCL